jgi:hypothetical protein
MVKQLEETEKLAAKMSMALLASTRGAQGSLASQTPGR